MPALHDFARFIFYAKEVATNMVTILAIEEREKCTTMVLSILQAARLRLGCGMHAGQLVQSSACERLLECDDTNPIAAALEKFRATLETIATGGYGVLHAYRIGALLNAVIAACIDELIQEPVWRDAFRYAAMNDFEGGSDMSIKFRLILIGSAFNDDSQTQLQSLLSLNLESDADLMTMFGLYVSSDSVSARDILRQAVSVKTESAYLRRIAMQSVMWNLTALDQNRTASNLGMKDRLSNSMYLAGVPDHIVYHSHLYDMIETAEQVFLRELQTARADAAKIAIKKGNTYVTGLRGRQTVVCVYIIVVLVASLLCAIFNWNDRDQVFDRSKDAFEISTIFLVSVFGLFKLTSEDPNALKNLASGIYLADDLADACRFLRSSSESVQKLLSIEATPADWPKDCSYGRAVDGDGLDLGPARVATLKQCGFFFLEGICKRPYFWEDSAVIEGVSFEVAQVSKDSESVGVLQFSTAPQFLMLA